MNLIPWEEDFLIKFTYVLIVYDYNWTFLFYYFYNSDLEGVIQDIL